MTSFDDRVLALGALLMALSQVRRIAETGQSDSATLQRALDSVFRLDAADTAAAVGGVDAVRPGLRLLRDYLTGSNKDEALGKLAMAVMQLERRFLADAAMSERVRIGLGALQGPVERLGSQHHDVVAGLASLYADTISQLRPRVMVQGNPHYLGQAGVVAEIRALLLAALRAAVLWRQMGGSLWDFLFQRREMAAAVDRLLG
jgi:high frequency lysogenization protein